MSTKIASDHGHHMPHVVYICAFIEFLTTLGSSIGAVPATRLIESAVCQRFYNADTVLAERLCKSDGVQSDLAYLLGAMSSFGNLPALLLTIPYGILSEHIDRRVLLLVNFCSSIISLLYLVAICYAPNTNLKLIWLSGLFDIIGGGSAVSQALLRTIIAEVIPSSSLSNLFYKISGINLLIRLGGVTLGSWLLQNGAPSTILVGICILSLKIPLLTYFPLTTINAATATATSGRNDIHLSYMRCNQQPLRSPNQDLQLKLRRPERSFRGEILESFQSLKKLMFRSRPFNMCLAIIFLNTAALDARSLLRPWMSKRYEWSLSETGYILSIEALLSAGILFSLQYLDKASLSQEKSSEEKRNRELWVAKISLLFGIAGSSLLALSGVRALFLVSAVVISGSVGFIDAIKAYFTAQLETQDIGRLYSTIMVVETLSVILSAPIWSATYSAGYGLGNVWVGLPFLCSSGVMVVTLLLVMMLRP